MREKHWYRIKESAKELGCSKNDIEHYIKTGQLTPAFELFNIKAKIKDPPGVGRQVSLTGTYHLICDQRFSDLESVRDIIGRWVVSTAVPLLGESVRFEILESCPIAFKDLIITSNQVKHETGKMSESEQKQNSCAETSDAVCYAVKSKIDQQEKPEELVTLRRKEHPTHYEVVTELKQKFPELINPDIAKLLFPDVVKSKENLTDSATIKRVERILKKEGTFWKKKLTELN